MMTLELDDETATLLNQLVEQEHISPEQLVKNVLLEHLEDSQDAKKADDAYQRYLEGGKISHNLNDVVKELRLDS
jgi:predicted transcriptional regulator